MEGKKKRKPTDVLSVSLFLLEHSHDGRINKNMCSESAIERLRGMGCGPPPEGFLDEKQKEKVYFPFSMTTEEFRSRLVEIYPKLQNQCYLLMKADKSNNFQYLNIANSSYNPKGISKSNLGQGRLYIRFGDEAEITALQSTIVTPVNCTTPSPEKIPRMTPPLREIRPKPPSSMLPNSVSNSAEALPVPAQNARVSQATTSNENHHTLPKNTDTTSNNTGTIFPADNNDSDAESIIGRCLENNELGMKVFSGLFQRLGLENSSLGSLSTNNASLLSSTNANGTPATFLHARNNLQTSILNQSTPTNQQPDNQMTALGNLSSTPLHQLDSVNQVHSLISSQPDFPETHMLAQNPLSVNTNIPPVWSSTRDIPQTTMYFAADQQTYTQDLTDIDLFLEDIQSNETNQNDFPEDFLLPFTNYIEDNDQQPDPQDPTRNQDRLNSQLVVSKALQNGLTEQDISQFEKFITDKLNDRIRDDGHIDVYPELCTMENIYLSTKTVCTTVRSVKLHRVGKLNELLEEFDEDVVRKFEHHLTWLNEQQRQSSLRTDRATVLAKMLPSLKLLEELYLSDAGLDEDEDDVEKVLKALKSCKKLKILDLDNNKVGARGVTALAKMLPSLKLLEVLYLFNAGLNEVDVEKVLKALKSCKKLKKLNLGNNTVGARGATALAKMLPSFELLEGLCLSDAGLDEDVEKVLEALKSCKKLKILNLNNNTVGAKGATALIEMLPSLKLLEWLCLSHAGLDEDVEKVLEALKSCKKLKKLNLGKNTVGARGATALIEMLPSLELLEGLALSNAGLDEDDVEKVLKALKSCKKLKILYLNNNIVGAKGATALVEMLPSLELLEGLALSNAGLDEDDVEKVLKALKSCKKLKILYLDNNIVGAKGATALVEMLPSFELLEELYLYDAGLDEDDVEKVLKALKSCKKLKILNLGFNTVGARGATALAKMFPSLELLEELYLSRAALDEVDVEKVLEALKSCKKLKELHLGNNKVGARGATALAKMLPSFSYFKLLYLRNVSLDEEMKTKLRATASLSKIKIIW